MGYSIFVIAKTKELQTSMSAFLEHNMVCYNKHFHNSDDNYFGLRLGADISYGGESVSEGLEIGFDYNACGGEREHILRIVKWMTRVIGTDPDVYYYDGESTPVNPPEETEAKEFTWNRLDDDVINFITSDIQRLDDLWNSGILGPNKTQR